MQATVQQLQRPPDNSPVHYERRHPKQTTLYRLVQQHAACASGCFLCRSGCAPDEADSGAVTLIQRFGSAANLNIHVHCLVLDGVYRRDVVGAPAFVEEPEPTDEALQSVLHKIITRTTQAAQPSGGVNRGGGLDVRG